MALIHQEASEDFPEKSVGSAALSLVGFNMVIWGVGWGCWGDSGGLWDGVVGTGPSSLVLMSLGSGLGTWYRL